MLLLVAGALAASSFIIAKKPDAKKAMDKIAPYQGIIGVVLLIMMPMAPCSEWAHM